MNTDRSALKDKTLLKNEYIRGSLCDEEKLNNSVKSRAGRRNISMGG